MKFATFYHENFSSIGIDENNVDEYNITFNTGESNYEVLQNKISQWNKRVNIWWNGEIDIDKMLILNQLNDNIYIRLSKEHIHQIDKIKENNLKFFLDENFKIHSYWMLRWIIKDIKPSEIYISDDLCYNLENVYNICKRNNIKLRIILNKIPSIDLLCGISETAPIFRPQDMDLLSLYFSTGEFDYSFGEDSRNELNCNWETVEPLYRRWFVQKNWTEDLGYLNQDILIDFPSASIPEELTEYKIKCNHRCMSSQFSICTKCERHYEIGKFMDKQNYVVKRQ